MYAEMVEGGSDVWNKLGGNASARKRPNLHRPMGPVRRRPLFRLWDVGPSPTARAAWPCRPHRRLRVRARKRPGVGG